MVKLTTQPFQIILSLIFVINTYVVCQSVNAWSCIYIVFAYEYITFDLSIHTIPRTIVFGKRWVCKVNRVPKEADEDITAWVLSTK